MNSLQFKSDIKFIKNDLIPEMVYNRCFCDQPNSREFVELESVEIVNNNNNDYYLSCFDYPVYRVKVIVRFSDVPVVFNLLIKLLKIDSHSSEKFNYAGFLNEEITWNKATLDYDKKKFFPRYYAVDMGRYEGRPVVVVEDLEANGYKRILNRKLNLNEGKLIVELIARFHSKGLVLKKKNNESLRAFRELYAKYEDMLELSSDKGFYEKLSNELLSLENRDVMLKKWTSCTLCQGLLLRENLWFRIDEITGLPVDVRILDWSMIRLGPITIDLMTILTECRDDLRQDLIDFYANKVIDVAKNDHQVEIVKEELLLQKDDETKIVGDLYASIVSKFCKS